MTKSKLRKGTKTVRTQAPLTRRAKSPLRLKKHVKKTRFRTIQKLWKLGGNPPGTGLENTAKLFWRRKRKKQATPKHEVLTGVIACGRGVAWGLTTV